MSSWIGRAVQNWTKCGKNQYTLELKCTGACKKCGLRQHLKAAVQSVDIWTRTSVASKHWVDWLLHGYCVIKILGAQHTGIHFCWVVVTKYHSLRQILSVSRIVYIMYIVDHWWVMCCMLCDCWRVAIVWSRLLKEWLWRWNVCLVIHVLTSGHCLLHLTRMLFHRPT